MSKLRWTQRQDIGPPALGGHAMATDPGAPRVVLFGGAGADRAVRGDTWGWDGELWTQLDDIGPSARWGHAMVADTARSKVVLFGGGAASNLGDTWEWDGGSWTQVADTGPSPRSAVAMAYDVVRGRTVLFGGHGAEAMADTWEWDGESWTQVDDTGPSARFQHAMAHDEARHRTVLFGGVVPDTPDDTWEWDGDHWTQVADTGPGPRAGASLTWAPGGCVLFGGFTGRQGADPLATGDTWTWDGTDWVQRADFGPSPRAGHSAALGPGRDRVVLFGGGDAVTVPANAAGAQTWELMGISPAAPPDDLVGVVVHLSPDPVRVGETLHVSLTVPLVPVATVVTISCEAGVLNMTIPPMVPDWRAQLGIPGNMPGRTPPFDMPVEVTIDGRHTTRTVHVVA